MSEKKLKVEIEFEHKGTEYTGTITNIRARDQSLPWFPDNSLIVYIDFHEPYPAGDILMLPITIPAMEYSRPELLAAIREEGTKQIIDVVVHKRAKDQRDQELQHRRQYLDTLAQKAVHALS